MPLEQLNDKRKESFWHSIVVSTAKGLDDFFWRLAWFVLLVAVCFSGCLKRYFTPSVAVKSQVSEPPQQVVADPPSTRRDGGGSRRVTTQSRKG